MSDSDDTEVLLLIPPKFFFVEPSPDDEISAIFSNFQFAFMSSQSELESINARLSQIERNFSTSSDISSISNCTVRSADSRKRLGNISPRQFCHSTPKCTESTLTNVSVFGPKNDNNGILQEIDSYLQRKPDCSAIGAIADTARMEASNWSKQEPNGKPLISLSEIWGQDENDESLALQEERLRRQHCERTIQALQAKLLEYQQKIAVAIQVDKKKDLAFHKLSNDLQRLDEHKSEHIKNLESENEALKNRKDFLEKELTHMLELSNSFQGKNQILETKISNLMRSSEETGNIYKKQIDELEVRLSNSQHNESRVKAELANITIELSAAQLTAQRDSINVQKIELLQGELTLIKQQKYDITEKYKEERSRAESLQSEQQMLRDSLSELKRKEINILKELETQRISLKSYYQQQLENVVAQKLSEFQSQLDTVEENLRSEGKDREKLLAERAIKQIEMINAKNEQEIALLQEKHNEEVELYRLQLRDASKTIDEQREKLNLYKSKRSDIASKLHNVMQCQWEKALEILTSPNTSEKRNEINPENLDPNKLDGLKQTTQDKVENELFETPTSSRNKKVRDKAREDQLNAYIQLLLNKSPRDLENLNELLAKSNTQDHKMEMSQKLRRDQKPPWK